MKIECPNCRSKNTQIELEEEYYPEEGEEILIVEIKCNDCKRYSPFPDDLDWRDYE